MKRREFIGLSAAGVLGLCLEDKLTVAEACSKRGSGDYSVVILGDTHFDTEPASVYHSNYNEMAQPRPAGRVRKKRRDVEGTLPETSQAGCVPYLRRHQNGFPDG